MAKKLLKILLALDATGIHDRNIIRGVASFSREKQLNWDIRIVSRDGESAHYTMLDPLYETQYQLKWIPDGMIISAKEAFLLKTYKSKKIPSVVVDEKSLGFEIPPNVPSISADDLGIARCVAMEYIERGMTSLAYCGIPDSPLTYWSRIREQEFERVAKENNVSCSIFPAHAVAQKSLQTQKKVLISWLQSLKKTVGIMACYDIRAIHILYTCREIGLSVPDEVAIIGSGNDRTVCELSIPSLSSVEQGGMEIGTRAAATLHSMLLGDVQKTKQCKIIASHGGIIARESSDFWGINDEDVRSALEFIRNNASNGIFVKDVVDIVQISRSSLEQRFSKLVGHSIHTEIKKCQTRKVSYLLRTTYMTLEQIAEQTGFPHIQHMATLFRKHFGLNPTEYRLLHRQ
ncbi:MAG: AraC family transcriptional regulator [Thermoguttaceae bacterium]